MAAKRRLYVNALLRHGHKTQPFSASNKAIMVNKYFFMRIFSEGPRRVDLNLARPLKAQKALFVFTYYYYRAARNYVRNDNTNVYLSAPSALHDS